MASALATAIAPAVLPAQQRRPNVVLIITDDQGYGDLSLHGNPHLETPHLDAIGREGVQCTHFHVNPVCSPTRSSLLTGRYYYRTGVVDTYLGRSMMHSDEVTLAEVLRGAGYRTGLFGKWHLGDCYPLRAVDQGFEQSLNCTGGGLTQPSDPPGNSYFDPMLLDNGRWVKKNGYCTDIFMDAALGFIEANRERPFFAYIATNAPHDPLQVDEKYWAPFRKQGLADREARIYGMVKNVDDNVGRLLGKLRELRIEQDTIVVFLTDNGPQSPRFNAGMRGRKGTVYEGGIRVPFFFRWPRMGRAGSKVPQLAAHIDVMPTILEACGAAAPKDRAMDGRSLLPLLQGRPVGWPERTLFFQWHRGDRPNPFQAAAAIGPRYKLVDGRELYDLSADAAESSDIAAAQPEIVRTMRAGYERWFADVSATRQFEPPKIYLGAAEQNPVTLTRQDWRGPKASWDAAGLGHWEVDVRRAGKYEVRARVPKAERARKVTLRLRETQEVAMLPGGADQLVFGGQQWSAGPGQILAEVEDQGKLTGAHYLDVTRL